MASVLSVAELERPNPMSKETPDSVAQADSRVIPQGAPEAAPTSPLRWNALLGGRVAFIACFVPFAGFSWCPFFLSCKGLSYNDISIFIALGFRRSLEMVLLTTIFNTTASTSPCCFSWSALVACSTFPFLALPSIWIVLPLSACFRSAA